MDEQYIPMAMPPNDDGQVSGVGSCKGGIFVPVQNAAEMWPPAQALMMGTAFPCLFSPYEKGANYHG